MNAPNKPVPGTPAALLDVAIRSVTEGRYRYAHLHFMWQRDRVSLDDVAALINDASTISDLPDGLSAAAVIDRARPANLPVWLDTPIDVEIGRICSGLDVASSEPEQLVGRIAAAVCVDVCADTTVAAIRAAHDGSEADLEPTSSRRSRMIHLDLPELIALEHDELSDTGPSSNPFN